MKKDVDEMSRMLEAYLAFARGDAGEQSAPTDMAAFLEELQGRCRAPGPQAPTTAFHGYPVVTVRPECLQALPRQSGLQCARFAQAIAISGQRDHRYLTDQCRR